MSRPPATRPGPGAAARAAAARPARPPRGGTPERRARLLVGAASLVLNALGLVLPLAILQLYDRVIPNAATATLGALVALAATAMAIEALLNHARASLLAWLAARADLEANARILDAILRPGRDDQVRQRPGDLLEALQASARLREGLNGALATSVADLPFALLFLGLVLAIGGWLAAVPATVIAVAGLVAVGHGRAVGRLADEIATGDARRTNFLTELFRSLPGIKAAGLEAVILRRYERLATSAAELQARASDEAGTLGGFATAAAGFNILLTTSVGAVLVVDGALSVGSLAACSLLANRAVQPVQRCLEAWSSWRRARAAAARLDRFMRAADGPGAAGASRPGGDLAEAGGPPPPPRAEIRLERVTFGYPGRPPLLREVDLAIERGELVAVTGPTGAGKTALLSLMRGIERPSGGRVLVRGAEPGRPGGAAVAYVPQHAELVEGTLEDNLLMFEDGLRGALPEVLAELGLDATIAKLRAGLATPVGGTLVEVLPQGVIQRVAIARALLRDPEILLFDAANAALDQEGDAAVRRTLARQKGRRTVVVVTLRPSLLRLADRVLHLGGGRIADAAPTARAA